MQRCRLRNADIRACPQGTSDQLTDIISGPQMESGNTNRVNITTLSTFYVDSKNKLMI
jgi:hypothetical protein